MASDSDLEQQELFLVSRPAGPALWRQHNVALVESAGPSDLRPGQLLARAHLLAPAGGGWTVGRPCPALVVGLVLASRADGYHPGQLVRYCDRWRLLAVVEADRCTRVRCLGRLGPELALGCLGGVGQAAYITASRLARPGRRVLLAGAASGWLAGVGQLLRLLGSTAVACTGSKPQASWLRSMGVPASSGQRCGAEVDLVLDCGARVASEGLPNPGCAMLAGPETAEVAALLEWTHRTFGFTEREYSAATWQLASWLRQGQLRDWNATMDGFERLPEAILAAGSLDRTLVRVELPDGVEVDTGDFYSRL